MIDLLLSFGLAATVAAAIAFFWTGKPSYGFWAAGMLASLPVLHGLQWLLGPREASGLARAAATGLLVVFDLVCLVAAACLAWLAKRRRDTM